MAQDGRPGDYLYWYEASRAILRGVSPYSKIPAMDPERFVTPFFYPLPTALLTIPFAWLPYAVSGGVFVALTSGLLAYGLLYRGGGWALVTLLSPAFIISVIGGTWTIPLAAAGLLPWLAFVFVAKPNLAVPLWFRHPAWWPILSGAALCGVSFLIQPTWLTEWLAAMRSMVGHPPPLVSSGAFVVLLLLTRWQSPASWFVIAMACVPQQAYVYDQLPLWLVPERKGEYLVLTFASWAVFLPWLLLDPHLDAAGWRRMEVLSLTVHYAAVTWMIVRRSVGVRLGNGDRSE
jgi:hypothetical protein